MPSKIENSQVIVNDEVQKGPLAPYTYQVKVDGKTEERIESGVWVGKYLYAQHLDAENDTDSLQVFPLDTPIDQLDSTAPLLEIPDFDFLSPTAGQALGIPLGVAPTGEVARTFPTNRDIKGGPLYRLGNTFAAYANFGESTTGIESFDSAGNPIGFLLGGTSNVEVFTPTNILNADGSTRSALFAYRVSNNELRLARLVTATGQLTDIPIAQNGVTADNVPYTADQVESCITSDGNNFYFQYNQVSYPSGKLHVERVVQSINPETLAVGEPEFFTTNSPELGKFGGFSSLDRSPSSVVLDNDVTVSLANRNQLTVDTPVLAPMPQAQIPYGVIASAGGTTDLPMPPDGRQGIVYLQPDAIAKLPAGPSVWRVVSHGGGLVDLTNLGVSIEALIAGITGQGDSSTVTLNGPNGQIILKFPISPADLIAKINGTFKGIGAQTSTTTTTAAVTSSTTTEAPALSSSTTTTTRLTSESTPTVTGSPTDTTTGLENQSTTTTGGKRSSDGTTTSASKITRSGEITRSPTTTSFLPESSTPGASSSTTTQQQLSSSSSNAMDTTPEISGPPANSTAANTTPTQPATALTSTAVPDGTPTSVGPVRTTASTNTTGTNPPENLNVSGHSLAVGGIVAVTVAAAVAVVGAVGVAYKKLRGKRKGEESLEAARARPPQVEQEGQEMEWEDANDGNEGEETDSRAKRTRLTSASEPEQPSARGVIVTRDSAKKAQVNTGQPHDSTQV